MRDPTRAILIRESRAMTFARRMAHNAGKPHKRSNVRPVFKRGAMLGYQVRVSGITLTNDMIGELL